MTKKEKSVVFLKGITAISLFLSFTLVAIGFNVNGITQNYFFFIGGSILVSSVLIFLFGLFMFSMDDVTDAPKNYHNLNQNIHHFQTNQFFHQKKTRPIDRIF
ncbi:hypothetical protein [Aquibacillus sediminis]|uniref:hypothetical protein n=1 Tax=Aquibacillus sediminis TaxID=2574734 RepID=UPI001108DC67|nr:hypothetical protein [Aquibacillus sediminis]